MIVVPDDPVLVERSDSATAVLVPPPGIGRDVCNRCQTWNDCLPASDCTNCQEVEAALGSSPLSISVVTLYRKPSEVRDWLTRYKGRVNDPMDGYSADSEVQVQALLWRFFREHEAGLRDGVGGFDAIVVVPSSTPRNGKHPLEDAFRAVLPHLDVVAPLVRGNGELGFRRPARNGFQVVHRGLIGARVLLCDDVYTTGARLNSAAYALVESGIEVVGASVIGRRVNPEYDPRAQRFWDRQVKLPFDWLSSPHIA